MSLLTVRFEQDNAWGWGLLREGAIFAPASWSGRTTGQMVMQDHDTLAAEVAQPGVPSIPLAELRLLSPVTAGQQLLFQLGNYHSHLREVGMGGGPRPRNVFFSKAASALAPAVGQVVRPPDVRLLDYEVELGLVIGSAITGPTRIGAREIGRLVRAITLVNDMSARDHQLADGQYFLSKSHRGFCAVGPGLLLLREGEFDGLGVLQLRLWVNGKLRQDCPTSDMVYQPHESLSQLSKVIDLQPGDLVSTGTPGGCAIRAPGRVIQKVLGLLPDGFKLRMYVRAQDRSGRYLKPGDRMTATLSTAQGQSLCGTQDLTVVAAPLAE